MTTFHDDLGATVELPEPARRIVCLVPSLTEALAGTGRLVGATEWCTHPADLDVARVRGTKNPDLAAIAALSPDLVVANMEENRELDVRRLRERGIPVWVTVIDSVPEAIASMRRLYAEALSLPDPEWLRRADELWSGEPPAVRTSAAVAIWRDPWMVVGSGTFTGDLLSRVGVRNVYDDLPRYPSTTPAGIIECGPEVVLLPDEPYEFTAEDGPEAFPGMETVLISGRLLTWYGPSLVEARRVLEETFG